MQLMYNYLQPRLMKCSLAKNEARAESQGKNVGALDGPGV